MMDQQDILGRTRRFAEVHGRRPRILLTAIDQVGVDRRLKKLATQFADAGFNVDLNTGLQSPEHVARTAVENDVHCVGLTGISDRHRPLLQRLSAAMDKEGGGDIAVVLWVDPDRSQDAPEAGENILVFTEDAPEPTAAGKLLDFLCRTVPSARP